MFASTNSAATVMRLVDLVGVALNRVTYEKLLLSISEGKDASSLEPSANSEAARYHRAKIIREESKKQFSHPLRPSIEPILNAVDARPEGSQKYIIDVVSNGKSVQVSDHGMGMSLETILKYLLIPFSSEKNGETDIGRFGVGFFSSLEYCLSKPNTNIKIETSTHDQAHDISFKADSSEVEDIFCSIQKTKRINQGTKIKFDLKHSKRELKEFISTYLEFFDPERAIIKYNGRVINKEPAGVMYKIPLTFDDGTKSTCRINIQNTKEEGKILLYSQGVFINSGTYEGFNVKIDMPSKARVVEGRDDFKHDRNYTTIFRHIVEYLCDNTAIITNKIGADFDMADFIANLLDKADLKYRFEDLLKDKKDLLFPGIDYIVKDFDQLEGYVNIRDFFGEEILSRVYAPKTDMTYYFWSEILPPITDREEHFFEESTTTYEELIQDCPAIQRILEYLRAMNGNTTYETNGLHKDHAWTDYDNFKRCSDERSDTSSKSLRLVKLKRFALTLLTLLVYLLVGLLLFY